jgi:catechol 2,3-dioxygenase-like lactoylglutathione lyase family enzyme
MLTATMVVATIPVTDLDQSKRFYGEALGLTPLWENPVSVRYRCGDQSELSIFKRPPVETVHTIAHFEVDDIEAAVADLEAKGVTFLDYTEGPLVTTGHIAQLGPARAAWFTDPDGHTLGLRQG